ncbi:MAG: DUF5674 family protein [Candidatus Azambacteria bacterium]|nr:DUF5674 family protein [Candidatus Azambacteria bacterium]
MEIKIVKDAISKKELEKIAENQFGSVVKAVVDIEKEIIAIGGDLHADEEASLLQQGSSQENLWGINLYIDKPENKFIEFDSMINVRPSQNNRTRGVESLDVQKKIRDVISKLIL